MIIDKVVTHIDSLSEEERKSRHIEKVFLQSDDLVKRIQRVVTDHGKELGISLAHAKELVHGDVLYMDDHSLIVIHVLPDELLVIYPRTIKEMGEVAHSLGNRHLPAQFEGEKMLVQYDYLVEELLQKDGIPCSREKMAVRKAFRHVDHRH
ncbi:urease accessory protein UreE [Paenibacillus endoradicis]|uniref:urease accessory protein UreE n=1 Tax=Paenibacillus endoradicis TaxID=2972487 RepID=UPI00215952B5|nr:urease accessory protein UreE [Paenibacillus endoradicis]MCR8659797.1 urease accessory protein UreE [Paenibacillus endoradicis]